MKALSLEVRGGQTIEDDTETGSFSVLFGKKLNDATNLMFATEYEDNAGGGLISSRDWSRKMVGQIRGLMVLSSQHRTYRWVVHLRLVGICLVHHHLVAKILVLMARQLLPLRTRGLGMLLVHYNPVGIIPSRTQLE